MSNDANGTEACENETFNQGNISKGENSTPGEGKVEVENNVPVTAKELASEPLIMEVSGVVSEVKKKKKGKKRKSDSGGLELKRRKISQSQKNALMLLNEVFPGLTYVTENQCGPDHEPCFDVSVVVEGRTFHGQGRSKQLAKHAAAEAALNWLQSEGKSLLEDEKEPEHFEASVDCETNLKFSGIDQKNTTPNSSISEKKLAAKLNKMLSDGSTQNPLKMMNELRPGLSYTLVRENASSPTRRFVMSVSIDGCIYEAFGASKKSAKIAVAKSVLSKLYNVKFTSVIPASMSTNNHSVVYRELLNFPQVVADKIAKCVYDTFDSIMLKDKEHSKWKVLAGFVMTKDEDMKDMEVISFATGTKHLNGEYISMNGGVINDCHAEIVSRRCLKDFFFSQLELHVHGKGDQSIFEKKPSGKFGLLPNLKFHLFISTSPCGDARIFSVHSGMDPELVDSHPNRKARGLLRTKIESGEGTIPVKLGMEGLTWDGILEGLQRYLNMSCSDKIASWTVLGLQGSLLSNFIEPVYLESIVLGKLFYPAHLYRALCGRFISTLKALPPPFELHKPKMSATTTVDIRQLTKSPNFCVNWTVGLDSAEVILAKTGKLYSGLASRLAKSSFILKFCLLYHALFPSSSLLSSYTYSMAKALNPDYVTAKKVFVNAFVSAGLGAWVKKPNEEVEFELAFLNSLF